MNVPVSDRYFPLEDIHIRSGSGRVVEAYATVFDSPAEVGDQDGNYLETHTRTSFDKTLRERAGRFQVYYNHGQGLTGPDPRAALPIGKPLEVRADAKGVFTVTEYSTTPLAEEVLQLIKEGVIKGQSFTGAFVKSNPVKAPPRGYRRNRDGSLPSVTRMETALLEYGPTPFPTFQDAAILSVRASLIAAGYSASVPFSQALTRSYEPGNATGTPDGAATATGEPRTHSDLRDHIRRQRILRGI